MTFLCGLSDKTQSNTQIIGLVVGKTKQGKMVVYVCANLGCKVRGQGNLTEEVTFGLRLKGTDSWVGAQAAEKS